MLRSSLRICKNGHKYYKSSDCPVCPVCEKDRETGAEFLSRIPAPARRALERERINTLSKLSKYTEQELLKRHGIGPTTIPKLRVALKEKGFSFRQS